jgi:hypothetical protein
MLTEYTKQPGCSLQLSELDKSSAGWEHQGEGGPFTSCPTSSTWKVKISKGAGEIEK